MDAPALSSLRVDDQRLAQIAAGLNERPQPHRGPDRREAPRYPYRALNLRLTLRPGDPAGTTCDIAARNISRGGLGALSTRFVYPGTACVVTLRGRHGQDTRIAGRVTHCRYLPGSGTVYELGVALATPVDAALFAAEAQTLRVLLVDASPRVHELIEHFVAQLNTELTSAETLDEAAAAALSQDFDLILLDLENPSWEAFRVTRELRKAGYLGPIVGLAVQTGRSLRNKCEAAGCTGYLPKPLTPTSVAALLNSLRIPPLYSTLADQAHLVPLINRFVAELRPLARRLSAAVEAGDVKGLHTLARQLRADAGSYGYAAITQEAEHVQALAAIDAPKHHLRSVVYDLIHLCLVAHPATHAPAHRSDD